MVTVGGAALLARLALENVEQISPLAPLVVFAWVVGFFLGHAGLEKLLSKQVAATPEMLFANEHEQMDIDLKKVEALIEELRQMQDTLTELKEAEAELNLRIKHQAILETFLILRETRAPIKREHRIRPRFTVPSILKPGIQNEYVQ